MEETLVQAIAGISLGGLYFLIASGLTLLLGSLNVINLAHGSFYMVGAYLATMTIGQFGASLGFLLAFALVPLAVVAFAAVVEFAIVRHTYDRGHFVQLLATFGLLLVIDDLIRVVFGTDPRTVGRPEWLSGSVEIFNMPVAKYSFFIIFVSALIAVSLIMTLHRSMWGKRLRATVDDPEMVGAVGVNVRRIRLGLFLLAACLAAIAGVIVAPSSAVQPGMDVEIIITAFAVTIVGGLGSVLGALMAAMLIGVVQSVGSMYIERGSIALIFAVMVLVLAFRPTGLLGATEGIR